MSLKRTVFSLAVAAAFVLPCGVLAQTVLLVQGTSSTPNEPERNAARSATRRLKRWFDEIGVPCETRTDEEASAGIPDSCRVVVLGYNPTPQAAELAALQRFVSRGGKLLVFYSASPGLAKLMHVRLGEYKAASQHGRWAAMRFNSHAPPHTPPLVRQNSRNIRPVYPAGGDARVIAHWESNPARQTPGEEPDPAWVRSDVGFWMSHILLDDGDADGKKRMLLAMVGAHEPAVWPPAARRALETAGRVGRFSSFSEAIEGIRDQAAAAGNGKRTRELLARAEQIHGELREGIDAQRYAEVVDQALGLRQALIAAYGAAQRPRANEIRAVWDHSGTGLYPGNWSRTCEVLAAQGITDILPNMLWAGSTHYRSSVLPSSETFRLYGDQPQACIQAAHRQGLRVHVWKVCWKIDGTSPELAELLHRQERLQVTDIGQRLDWLCPSDPANRRMEIDALVELAQRYEVDGIHLDYVRYPDSRSCVCRGCAHRFAADTRIKIANWPNDVMRGPLRNRFLDWRIGVITGFVREASRAIRAVAPSVKISAAVYGKYPSCAAAVGQDWPAWLRHGYVDFVCPMNYTEDLSAFEALTRDQLALAPRPGSIWPGIGVSSSQSRLDPAQVIDQINILRRLGAPGFALFDLNPAMETDTLPILRLGISAPE